MGKYNSDAVCHFLPGEDNTQLIAVNMVYEKKPYDQKEFTVRPNYGIYSVVRGSGVYATKNAEYRLKEGDLFFVLPDSFFAYYADCAEGWAFTYITFMGQTAKSLVERAGVSYDRPVIRGCGMIKGEFLHAIERITANPFGGELISLAALYSAFGYMTTGKKESSSCGADIKREHADNIIKYINENYNNDKLTLSYVANKFSLNSNYMSRLFKEVMGVNFSCYLTTVRLQRACTLMEQGITSIKNVASLVGFSDALYFSKIFKERMGISPKEHIGNLRVKKKASDIDMKNWSNNFYI